MGRRLFRRDLFLMSLGEQRPLSRLDSQSPLRCQTSMMDRSVVLVVVRLCDGKRVRNRSCRLSHCDQRLQRDRRTRMRRERPRTKRRQRCQRVYRAGVRRLLSRMSRLMRLSSPLYQGLLDPMISKQGPLSQQQLQRTLSQPHSDGKTSPLSKVLARPLEQRNRSLVCPSHPSRVHRSLEPVVRDLRPLPQSSPR